MKRFFLCVLAMASCLHFAAAQSTQPCLVQQYNQKSMKTPLSGVEVMVSNAGSTVSDKDGRLTLTFRTLKPGDKVKLINAKKAGFELFNAEAVEQWNISRDQTPFTLVLVKKDYFDQLKAKLSETSTDSYQRKYEQAIRELEHQKNAGKLKEEEFNRKYDALEEQYQIQLSNLDNYIDQFARIDLSEVSAEEQQILEMVEDGRIDEAVKAYEELDISGKLRQARESKKSLEDARARIEAETARQEEAIRELKARQEREIATLKLAGGKENYDKIGRILKENALADTTDVAAVWEYAYFAQCQRDYEEAERFWLICLHGDNSIYRQSTLWNNLGTLYLYQSDCTRAEEALLKALDLRSRLFADYPDALRYDIATTQLNLGYLYDEIRNYDKAEEYYLQSLDNYTQLFVLDPDRYRANLADIQLNLGALYRAAWHDNDKAEVYYLQALENYQLSFDQNPDAYRERLARIQSNLGILYRSRRDYAQAEKYFLQSLENRTSLYNQNPDAYRSDLVSTQNRLASLYNARQDYSKAIEYLDKTIALMPEEANNYDTKGEILLKMGDESGALEMWKKTLELDPDFLSRFKDGTDLYNGLKQKGLIQ